MDAIGAFRICRQGNISDFLHASHDNIGPTRWVRLGQVEHLIELALWVIDDGMSIKLQARIFPRIFLYHQWISRMAFCWVSAHFQPLRLVDMAVVQEETTVHGGAVIARDRGALCECRHGKARNCRNRRTPRDELSTVYFHPPSLCSQDRRLCVRA